jgi:hypothetical protein
MGTVVSGLASLQKRRRGGARVDDRRRAADEDEEEMAGSLNVCHRQRARVLGGQWLAVDGGRYHVQASYNVVWAGGGEQVGLMSRLGVRVDGWRSHGSRSKVACTALG